MQRHVTAMDKEKMTWKRKIAFTGVLPMFEELLVPQDTHNHSVE